MRRFKCHHSDKCICGGNWVYEDSSDLVGHCQYKYCPFNVKVML